ncbi:MAG: 5-amino-6-(D-ribitylamino)uracil--L-tyrosine 4-hydroxyphenyl transferase CofH [Pseudomonadota bacterium]|nr:5-amino-6-(D-ribitylamino)uracil--L-tyrosine 4-hydroxyphenyl transferase CofH [Pseudomonadota bacterium]
MADKLISPLAGFEDPKLISEEELRSISVKLTTTELVNRAGALRDEVHGDIQSYSPKVFIPLTNLCRDVCHYCTFSRPPVKGEDPYMTPEEVLGVARRGAAAGCREALFTLGDKPELRFRVARKKLEELGHKSTISYLIEMCHLVRKETGLLPHANPGVLNSEEVSELRRVTVSQGIMLESVSERLCRRGGPHFGSPDKNPTVRLRALQILGEQSVPTTSGILIGLGETRDERVSSILALRRLHLDYGHLQEIIVQNFRAKAGTKMADSCEPGLDELMWTIAVARIAFGPAMNIQAPPNLTPAVFGTLLSAGINDWGGISPVTPDHVNPEAPWPELQSLEDATRTAGKTLVPRLAIYPEYLKESEKWLDPDLLAGVLNLSDSDGYGREGSWSPGASSPVPVLQVNSGVSEASGEFENILSRACNGVRLSTKEVVQLFEARGKTFQRVLQVADQLRQVAVGNVVRYVVNRNINYTNVCYFRCQFCAFSKGKMSENLRGNPYDLPLSEITRRVQEAWRRGATEVCMQGGIHPDYTGETYLSICKTVKSAVPEMHIHAFSPLEVAQGASTLDISVTEFLVRLREAGLDTLPGTAAEILDDPVRRIICPDKLDSEEWLDVVRSAHKEGFRSTATIMFGHVDAPTNWANHLLKIRDLQQETGGFTEFVPLPFVHMEAPLYLKGKARRGPTWRETLLMHAVARLVLHPLIPNIQVSWVKLGREGAAQCLKAGANDLGGTLMNESISRAAGNEHGQEMLPHDMEQLIRLMGREPVQRTTLYMEVSNQQRERSFRAAELSPVIQTPAKKYAHTGSAAMSATAGS